MLIERSRITSLIRFMIYIYTCEREQAETKEKYEGAKEAITALKKVIEEIEGMKTGNVF